MNILEEVKKLAEFLSNYKDFIFWLDVEFYACFAGILVALFIGYMATSKFLLKKGVPTLGKVIAGAVLCLAVFTTCGMIYNLLTYSKNKLVECKKLQDTSLMYKSGKFAKAKSPELEKLLSDIDTQIRQCIELDKK